MLGSRIPAVLVALLLLCCAVTAGFAADIVTVPTANQLKAGEVDLAAYHIELDDFGPVDNVRALTLYAGLTDKIELDVHRYDVDVPVGSGVMTIVNATYLVLPETLDRPVVVIGGRDLTAEADHASWFVSAAKTLNPPVGGPPTGPIFRAHLSLGTEDNTLLGEPRHSGLFGGLQVLVKPTFPQVGVVGLYDGQDIITAVTYTHGPQWPTMKGGTFGDHTWIGLSYTFNAK